MKKSTYFELPNLYLMTSVLLFVLYTWSLGVLAYFPEYSPYEYMGTFGEYSKVVYTERYWKISIIIIFWSTLSAHMVESIYVYLKTKQCNMTTGCMIKWVLCAFWIGYPSTRLISKYANEHKQKKFLKKN